VELWDAYRAAAGVTGEPAGSFAFGDSPELADELAELVLHGPKRATAGLLLELEHDGEKVPEAGDHWVVLDGRGDQVCVIRTTQVQLKPLREVDDAFAWDEGEGDRSLAWWRRGHDAYFSRRCEALGVPFNDEVIVVFERFDLVWPRP
jgi:uncharacterized protein YhfF